MVNRFNINNFRIISSAFCLGNIIRTNRQPSKAETYILIGGYDAVGRSPTRAILRYIAFRIYEQEVKPLFEGRTTFRIPDQNDGDQFRSIISNSMFGERLFLYCDTFTTQPIRYCVGMVNGNWKRLFIISK